MLSSAAYNRKLDKLALAIGGDLGAPALVAVQEAENLQVLQALCARIGLGYAAILEEGPDLLFSGRGFP